MRPYEEIISKYIHDGFNSLTNTEKEILNEEYEQDIRISFETKEKIRSEIRNFRRRERLRRNQFKERVAKIAKVYFEREMTVTVSKLEGKYYGFVTEDNEVVAVSILGKGDWVENTRLELIENET